MTTKAPNAVGLGKVQNLLGNEVFSKMFFSLLCSAGKKFGKEVLTFFKSQGKEASEKVESC